MYLRKEKKLQMQIANIYHEKGNEIQMMKTLETKEE